MKRPLKVLTVVGARPQFIKAAAVSRAGADRSGIDEKIVHTGQHYDQKLSRVFFDELKLPSPDYRLEIGSGPHGRQTGRMLAELEEVFLKENPDRVLVYGDTNSTLAGALAAAKLHLPLVHVEAGLRSFNRRMPEEINRLLTDHISNLLFCPTAGAAENLRREGITAGVHRVGDVMYDCLLFYQPLSRQRAPALLAELKLQPRSYCLATVHRAGNTDDRRRLLDIFTALDQVSRQGAEVILPLHPRTRKILTELDFRAGGNLRIIPPLSYLEMIALEEGARIILTDSGGIQKEAYWLKIPCVTLREETEWVETVTAGANILAGSDPDRITAAARRQENVKLTYRKDIYGDGHAAENICELLLK